MLFWWFNRSPYGTQRNTGNGLITSPYFAALYTGVEMSLRNMGNDLPSELVLGSRRQGLRRGGRDERHF
jgi:hypothetical protein